MYRVVKGLHSFYFSSTSKRLIGCFSCVQLQLLCAWHFVEWIRNWTGHLQIEIGIFIICYQIFFRKFFLIEGFVSKILKVFD